MLLFNLHTVCPLPHHAPRLLGLLIIMKFLDSPEEKLRKKRDRQHRQMLENVISELLSWNPGGIVMWDRTDPDAQPRVLIPTTKMSFYPMTREDWKSLPWFFLDEPRKWGRLTPTQLTKEMVTLILDYNESKFTPA